MRFRSSIITTLLVAGWADTGYSQPPAPPTLDEYIVNVEHIPLPYFGTVQSILRDQTGFLWFGTSRGLYKYDGYQVRHFLNGSWIGAEENAISAMLSLPSGAAGSLLLGTHSGLWTFDLQKEEFDRFFPGGEFSNEKITALARDSDGALWIGTESRGLFACNSSVRHYSTGNGLMNDGVNCLLFDHSGSLWIGMYGGALQAYDSKTSRFVYHGTGAAPDGSPTRRVVAFDENAKHELWVGMDDGVYVLDQERRRTQRMQLPSPLSHTVHSISRDPQGRVWIGATDLDILYYTDGAFARIPSSNRAGLESQSSTLYVDPVASDSTAVLLWVGTRNGVKKITFMRNPFTNWIRDQNGLVLDRGAVLSLYEDRRGILWVGLWGGGLEGLLYENGRYKRVHHFQHNPAKRSSLPDNDINPLYEDRDQRLWIGTGSGLAILDRERKNIAIVRYDREDTAGLADPNITAITEDRSGTFWVASHSGLSKLISMGPPRFDNFLNDSSDAHPYGGNKVSFLHNDRNGVLWVATFGRGLNRYNGDGTFRRFLCPSDPSGYHQNFIYSIHEDSRGIFWLSTRGGLASYNPASDMWVGYRIDDLQDIFIYGVSTDQSGNIWLSTEVGLVRFNRETGTVFRYSTRSGIAVSRLFSEFASISRKKLLIGGLDGFTEFSPEDLARAKVPPGIAITGVVVVDKLLPSVRLATGGIQLGYDQNPLTISFAVLDYVDPLHNGFAYKMAGMDKGWVHTGTRNYVTYAHLDPGIYTFHVKGYSSDHVWNETGTSITFTITPPFWETWWFRALAAVVVIGTIYAAYRYRLRRLLEVERLRLRIADDLHDDVGSNLSSISLGSQLALQQPSLDLEVRQQIEEIRENAVRTAETMRDIVWLINPKNDQLEDFVLRMRDVASKILNGISYRITVPDASLPRATDLSVRRNIFLIYKEALNNIAKHANAMQVEISLAYLGKHLVLSVQDDGVGFDLSAPRTGNGLDGFQRRANAIGAKMEVRSSPGQGTTVAVTVPLS